MLRLLRTSEPVSRMSSIVSSHSILEIDVYSPWLVCTGTKKPTPAEFKSLAKVLNITDTVSHFICPVRHHLTCILASP